MVPEIAIWLSSHYKLNFFPSCCILFIQADIYLFNVHVHIVDDTLQAPKGRSHRVAKLLEHIMLRRPDQDFVKLKDALIELGQVHVAKYLESSPVDNTDRAEEVAVASASKTDFSQDYVRGWKNLLVNNRIELVDHLMVNDELISQLIKFGVINVTFSETLKVIMSIGSIKN